MSTHVDERPNARERERRLGFVSRPRFEDYREKFASPYKAAELGYIDEIIRPEETRPRIIQALDMLSTKRETLPPKKHGNIPL